MKLDIVELTWLCLNFGTEVTYIFLTILEFRD